MSTEILEKIEDFKKEGWEIKEKATNFIILKKGKRRRLFVKEDFKVIKYKESV